MYGLSSREALAKRQTRWVQEVDKEVRTNPAQSAFSRDPLPNPVRDKSSIISMMVNDTSEEELNSLRNLCEELSRRCAKLEEEHKVIKKSKGDLVKRVEKLEELSERLLTLASNSTVGESVDIEAMENASEFSALTEPDLKDTYEFIPYAIKEDFAGRDNISTLSGTYFYMLVEVVGRHSEPLVIYPFGNETHLPHITECKLNITSDSFTEVLLGRLHKRNDGVYVINLENFQEDKYTYPLTLKCHATLSV